MSAISDLSREARADPPREKIDHKKKIDRKKKIYGVVTGMVIPHPPDPQALGRVLVRVPCIDSLDFVAWARVAVPMAGPLHGTYFVPNLGDEVLIAFEHGDVRVPYIIGCLWNHINRPPLPVSQAQIRAIRTLAGNQIVFTEVPPTITIQTPTPPVPIPLPPSPAGPHSTIMMMTELIDVTGKVVTIRSGSNNIMISPAGITLQAGVSVINLGTEGITIAVGANQIMLSAAGILIKGNPVNINPV